MDILISLGSNTPDKERKISEAIYRLRETIDGLRIKRATDSYETKAQGGGNRMYRNAIIYGETTRDITNLNQEFKQLERMMGRTEQSRQRGDVEIDIDIVEADGEILRPYDYAMEYYRQGKKKLESTENDG